MEKCYSEFDLKEMHEMFDSVDLNCSGKITEAQIYQLLKDANMKQSYRYLIMSVFDTGKKGYLDFSDFCEYIDCINHLNSNPKQFLKKIFNSIDTDDSGELTGEQTSRYADFLRILLSKDISDHLMQQIDVESSAKYSFEELCQNINLEI